MYVPEPFSVPEDEAQAMLAAARLGVLVTAGEGAIAATHLPFVYDRAARTLSGHMAAVNPHTESAAGPALVIFSGPEAYVSPNFYPSKAEHGRAVPTWNYEAVHVHGQARFIREADWLRDNVTALSERFEAGHAVPWTVADAPADYVERLLRGIVGVEIAIERIEAKRKLSQNRPQDMAAVIEGLSASERLSDRALAEVMKAL